MAGAARAAAAGETEEAELKALIRARSSRTGDFVLTSGRRSNLYLNLKPTMMDPRGAHLAARAFLERIRAEGPELVGGLEMGAVPLIGAVAALSDVEGAPVRTFFVRKEAKGHGTRERVEGLAPGESLQGRQVLIVDDVATTGGSLLQALDAAQEAGAKVSAALVLVDREEGAGEALQARGVRLLRVFSGAEFR
ncbi:MAG TPA: orotate phosphoribosyltransferase [Caulobacteraceae bacterium]|nr:orotate phosphoribosyltransferase [Caulobacteraceae bacterium]